MKLNTKKMTPLSKAFPDTFKDTPDSCLLHENENVPVGGGKPQDHDSDVGLTTGWSAKLVVTPLKACSRHSSKQEHYVTSDELEALVKAFGSAKIEIRGDEAKDEEQEEESNLCSTTTEVNRKTITSTTSTTSTARTSKMSAKNTKATATGSKTSTALPDNDDEGKRLGLYWTKEPTRKSRNVPVDVKRSYRNTDEDSDDE
ncbi:expressed unknown protein [Seminavis robusta]|uniref:Uncharacterized protein n=1 Tax=Seminavis robusta TaxID=568900 RepID=A0A9N8DYZ6_9STRA|nr:expressed unknown protein [Seminavis robusta]|eukprot:Sro379_g130510.1 n/a (201) ;mRNA; r:51030-51632